MLLILTDDRATNPNVTIARIAGIRIGVNWGWLIVLR
jgi:hypothetical protein